MQQADFYLPVAFKMESDYLRTLMGISFQH
jgi:hypothetical protein